MRAKHQAQMLADELHEAGLLEDAAHGGEVAQHLMSRGVVLLPSGGDGPYCVVAHENESRLVQFALDWTGQPNAEPPFGQLLKMTIAGEEWTMAALATLLNAYAAKYPPVPASGGLVKNGGAIYRRRQSAGRLGATPIVEALDKEEQENRPAGPELESDELLLRGEGALFLSRCSTGLTLDTRFLHRGDA